MLLFALAILPISIFAKITIAYNHQSYPVAFGVSKIESALKKTGEVLQLTAPENANIIIRVSEANKKFSLQKEGYDIRFQNNVLILSAIDAGGAMYAAFDVAEQIQMGKAWKSILSKNINPHFTVRALKFNLPWSSYRVGPAMDQHLEVCRDLNFWQSYIDQMAENRFNIISLWNVHPFSFMVKPVNFLLANNYSDAEMKEWKHFWTSLFRMCKDRAIEPFIVNWNIAVSPEFSAAYHVKERNDTSELVKRYTREVVTQVINEYPDLAGIGITLADWMSNFANSKSELPVMTPKDREDWIEETVVAGMKAADHPIKFLHRSVLSADPMEMRRIINNAHLADTTLVEIKFNWSHGHSTPILALTHDSNSGAKDDGYWNPLPDNYRVEWMVRNEDTFILRWGQPNFIREHIATNSANYVNGYFVGYEGYIPAKDCSHVNNNHKTWTYAFQKQWLFYMMWGRLLYNPKTPDNVFEAAFNNHYSGNKGGALLKAYTAASNMPLKLASFHGSTWDYTLYSEGFLAPFASKGLHDTVSSFISVDELIDHVTLDPNYVSIPDFVKGSYPKKAKTVTPLALASSLEADSKMVMQIVKQLRPGSSPTLLCELDDLETWAHLSSYFAGKLRAGVALQTYRTTSEKAQQQKAVMLLTKCVNDWRIVSKITAAHYKEVPYVDDHSSGGQAYKDALRFSWSKYLPQVLRDIELAKAPVTTD